MEQGFGPWTWWQASYKVILPWQAHARAGGPRQLVRSAADRQRLPVMLMPPAILTPMAARLGYYYLSVGKADKAENAYQEALRLMPNDAESLAGLAKARAMKK